MGYVKYKVSAPGSFMLMGEHAVVYGKTAIVCAAKQRIYIRLQSRNDRKIIIYSQQLGHYETSLDHMALCKPYSFILAVFQEYLHLLPHGCELLIDSQIPCNFGLGSSAAVTAAATAIIIRWLDLDCSAKNIFVKAREVVRKVQSIGSGADVAASVFGSVIAYQPELCSIEQLCQKLPVSLIYSGMKTPTVDVINYVSRRYRQYPLVVEQLFLSIAACTESAIEAIRQENWLQLGELMNIHQGLQESLGVSNPMLNEIINVCRQQKTVWGAKISGSGLGDCVVALGKMPTDCFPANAMQAMQGVQAIPAVIDDAGLIIHE